MVCSSRRDLGVSSGQELGSSLLGEGVSKVRLSVSGVSKIEIGGVVHSFKGVVSSIASGNGPTVNPSSSPSPEPRRFVFCFGSSSESSDFSRGSKDSDCNISLTDLCEQSAFGCPG